MTISSPYPDLDIPEVPLHDFVLSGHDGRLEKPALIDGPTDRTLTYGQLIGGVRRVAAGLAARGFSKGDVFAIYSPNVLEYAIAFHGVALAGGINTTVNPLYTVDELAFQLDHASARYLLTIPHFLEQAKAAAEKTGVEEVFVLGEGGGATPFAALMDAGEEPPGVDLSPRDDLVVLPYSSGTTGFPKGVMLSHYNLVANVLQAEHPQGTSERDVIVAVLPFFHIYGMTVIMNIALHLGATVVTMPRFDLEQYLELSQKHGATRAYLVPPIILALAKHPVVDGYDLSSLELILSGAAPLGADLAQRCSERLGCLVVQGYGMTETSPVTHMVPDMVPDQADRNRPGSIGFPVPNTECKFVSLENGDEIGPGERGELWIRGPQVMKGYLNNPDASAATLVEGWIRTGDVGYVDEDGYFFLVDRVKELIKYKGFQVAPAELEALLVSYPKVGDAAVIPAADEEAGEIPKAFVVPRGEVTAEEIMDFVAGRVAPHKKVRAVEFVEEIPKSASGKILRRVLIERERNAP